MNARLLISVVSLCLSFLLKVQAQGPEASLSGEITYITSENVYVRFNNTQGINPGDTLFILVAEDTLPVLIVNSISPLSCVCKPIQNYKPEPGVQIHFIPEKSSTKVNSVNSDQGSGKSAKKTQRSQNRKDSLNLKAKKSVTGSLTVRNYSILSEKQEQIKMRYILSLRNAKIAGDKISFDTYMSFSHEKGEWDRVKDDLFSALKIYNLSINFKPLPSSEISLGRKINPNFANIGAVDGLQITQYLKSFSLGGFIGSRPDYENYGYNPNLFQYGGFIAHDMKYGNGKMKNSIALVEQKNNSITDRRFLYLQHNQSIRKKIYILSSLNVDLYEKPDTVARGAFNLSSFYFLFRLQATKRLTLSLSYDLRDNIIYYETYKDYLNALIEDNLRQGLNTHLSYRLFNFATFGVRGSYRYKKGDPEAAVNLSAYSSFHFNSLKGTSTYLACNYLSSAYMSGQISSIRINKAFSDGRANLGLQYRYFHGVYTHSELKTRQHNTEVQLNWLIMNKLFLGTSAEVMMEKDVLTSRIYLGLTKRF